MQQHTKSDYVAHKSSDATYVNNISVVSIVVSSLETQNDTNVGICGTPN